MPRSRLNKRLVKQTERNLVLLVGGGIILIILFLTLGVKLLVNFSLFVEKKSDVSAQAQEQTFIIPPTLDFLDEATNSARLNVSGTAGSGKYIKLFLNGKQVKKADIKSDGTFEFRNVELEAGENSLKVKAVDENEKESKFSETTTVIYSKNPPDLSVSTPSDGQTYHKEDNPLRVSGETDPDVKVTVNGFWAVVDGEGYFYYNLPLKGGDNEIKIIAEDKAGNKSEKTLKVNYAE